jgi:hypothetical protein
LSRDLFSPKAANRRGNKRSPVPGDELNSSASGMLLNS